MVCPCVPLKCEKHFSREDSHSKILKKDCPSLHERRGPFWNKTKQDESKKHKYEGLISPSTSSCFSYDGSSSGSLVNSFSFLSFGEGEQEPSWVQKEPMPKRRSYKPKGCKSPEPIKKGKKKQIKKKAVKRTAAQRRQSELDKLLLEQFLHPPTKAEKQKEIREILNDYNYGEYCAYRVYRWHVPEEDDFRPPKDDLWNEQRDSLLEETEEEDEDIFEEEMAESEPLDDVLGLCRRAMSKSNS